MSEIKPVKAVDFYSTKVIHLSGVENSDQPIRWFYLISLILEDYVTQTYPQIIVTFHTLLRAFYKVVLYRYFSTLFA